MIPISVIPPTILLIDDDPDEYFILSQYFQDDMGKLEWSSNPVTGIVKALAIKPNVIILDQYIPGFDLLETIRQLKTLKELAPIPIIVSTGVVSPVIHSRLQEEGITHIICKPMPVSILRSIANLNL